MKTLEEERASDLRYVANAIIAEYEDIEFLDAHREVSRTGVGYAPTIAYAAINRRIDDAFASKRAEWAAEDAAHNAALDRRNAALLSIVAGEMSYDTL